VHRGIPSPPTTGCVPNELIPAPTCCDFFFVSENAVEYLRRIVVDGGSQAFDHQPVILELAL
jgi:endonuclease/exonuclease/phosphatase family metal-dependent hydrolase